MSALKNQILKKSILFFALLHVGCGGYDPIQVEDILHDSNLPDVDTPPAVAPYNGEQTITLDAQANLPTINDFHQKVIRRSCSGVTGVCHNQKEYPDMQSPQAFLSLINAPCNAAPNDPLTVYDRCERLGDTMVFPEKDSSEVEIGYLQVIPGDRIDFQKEEQTPQEDSPGLHIYTFEPLVIDDSDGVFYTTAQFNRKVNLAGTIQDLKIFDFEGKWWLLGDGKHLYIEIPEWKQNDLEELLASSIRQGDINRNNNFGAKNQQPLSLITPGQPNASYLIGRLLGQLAGESIPGTRMPLANLPPTLEEMVALTCLIETLSENQSATPSWAINYRNCSIRDDPNAIEVSGDGSATWSEGVAPLLKTNCGGCHGGDAPFAELDLVDDNARSRLLGPSTGKPLFNYVSPGNPSNSYLWLKLNNDPSIVGNGMPWNSTNGWSPLSSGELDTVRSWIEAGALDN